MSSENEMIYIEMVVFGQGSSSAQQIKPSICRVPDRLRKINPSAYSPGAVSIGPLHRHDELLQRWQEKKKIYMDRLLERTAEASKCDVNEIQRRCVTAMLEVAPLARASYAESFQDNDLEFAKLMLVDGCFILQFLHSSPIFINDLEEDTIEWDLLLLENQIPFRVLKHLFQLTLQNILVEISLTEYVLGFIKKIADQQFKIIGGIDDETECNHILDLLHKVCRPTPYSEGKYPDFYYCATDLHRAGVNFKRSDDSCFLPVEFQTSCSLHVAVAEEMPSEPVTPKSSTLKCIISQFKCLFRRHCLRLPPLPVYDTTETFFRNLIAHEQCFPNVRQFFTSYAVLMDTLIDSKEDVELLVKEKVVKNDLGANEDVVDLFNNLCKQILIRDQEFYYSTQWEELTNYRKRSLPKHIASLKRTYFGNPWARISFCAALVLFALTAIQTVFTVMSYFSL